MYAAAAPDPLTPGQVAARLDLVPREATPTVRKLIRNGTLVRVGPSLFTLPKPQSAENR